MMTVVKTVDDWSVSLLQLYCFVSGNMFMSFFPERWDEYDEFLGFWDEIFLLLVLRVGFRSRRNNIQLLKRGALLLVERA